MAARADARTPAPARDEGEVAVKAARASSEDEAIASSDDQRPAPTSPLSAARTLEPWRLVGRPYLVEDEPSAIDRSVDSSAVGGSDADGSTSARYTLWFRTRAEFRGVRQGTSITSDDHYKVGFITVDQLAAYVPRGAGVVIREARLVRRGRYCYSAALHVQGHRGSRGFPVQADGARLKVRFDLRGAPPQTRMAPVVAGGSAGEDVPPAPAERALGCRT